MHHLKKLEPVSQYVDWAKSFYLSHDTFELVIDRISSWAFSRRDSRIIFNPDANLLVLLMFSVCSLSIEGLSICWTGDVFMMSDCLLGEMTALTFRTLLKFGWLAEKTTEALFLTELHLRACSPLPSTHSTLGSKNYILTSLLRPNSRSAIKSWR